MGSSPDTHRQASPWDALMQATPVRLAAADPFKTGARPGSKLAGLLDELQRRGKATTADLADRARLTPRQVWGLLKQPRNDGQVQFEAGRWSLVQGFAGRDVERAAALLRGLGWRVVPPTVHIAERAPRDEIAGLRALMQAIVDKRHRYGWGPEADAAIEAARLALGANDGAKGPAARPVPLK